jgi:hypothetical protein
MATATEQLLSPEDALALPSVSPTRRQQVLVLYLSNSSLDSGVQGWSRYDGTGRSRPTTGDSDDPPYETGTQALCDGWTLFHISQLLPPSRGHEHDVSYLPNEFWFSRFVDIG